MSDIVSKCIVKVNMSQYFVDYLTKRLIYPQLIAKSGKSQF